MLVNLFFQSILLSGYLGIAGYFSIKEGLTQVVMQGIARSMFARLNIKLLLSTILTCALIVVAVSLYQGYLGLEQRKQNIQTEFANFERGAQLSIREAVWLYDWDMVKMIIENQTSQTLSYIEVCDHKANRCQQFGQAGQQPYLEHRSTILHYDPVSSDATEIGVVILQAHYEKFPAAIFKEFPQLLLTNFISIFGVAAIVFLLFHRQALKRLVGVERYARDIELQKIETLEPITVKKQFLGEDEIDHLADAINSMIASLKKELEQRRQLEQDLAQAQKMEALGTLAGGIAHDFNNILSAVLGFAQLSSMACEPGSKLDQYQSQIIQAGERAKKLIAQIMLFSRRAEPVREALFLADVVKDNLALHQSSLSDSISVKTDLEPGVKVLADPGQVHQILMNMVTNAGHAMKETGGILKIQVKRVTLADDKAESLNVRPGSYGCLVVEDTGPGIPEPIAERVFEPFFSTKKTGEGTGMGLAVAHGIIRAHGGAIELKSVPQQGATFYIYLPETDADVHVRQTNSEIIVGQGEMIVVVDDEKTVTDMSDELFTKLGYQTVSYNDPFEACQAIIAGKQSVDLLITDMTMPECSGIQLALELRRADKKFPILLWTGYAENIAPEELSQARIDKVLDKPFSLEVLAKTVRQILLTG